MCNDTIAAIATAAGESALSVIRLSGPEACAIAGRCFQPVGPRAQSPANAPTHTVHYGKFVEPGGHDGADASRPHNPVDEVLLTVLRAPRTFTKEDIVEISCHGGPTPTRAILDTLLSQGARPAEPGEFTRRAFLNGRIDLTQAEAVADIIHAKTRLALHAANQQLAGKLSQQIDRLRHNMLSILAHVEAHIDFPEEDIAPDTQSALIEKLHSAIAFIQQLIASAPEGRILRHGLHAAIIGRPNVGKSSLLNCLLERDRAIVSPTAGTTRDTIEETANIRGIPVVFTDTAGLRTSEDAIEQEGIRRSRESAQQADLLLHVLDISQPTPADAETQKAVLPESLRSKTRLILLNKSDLLPRSRAAATPEEQLWQKEIAIRISCRTGEGLETLKDAIKKAVWKKQTSGERFDAMINARHQNALQRAQQAAQTALQALQASRTLELVALDLHIAANAIGEIVGKTSTDDLLDKIFSQFCLGK